RQPSPHVRSRKGARSSGLAKWSRGEAGKVESAYVAQKRNEPISAVVRRGLALYRARLVGFPNHSIGVEIARHPGEPERRLGAKHGKFALHRLGRAWKIARLSHPHDIGPKGQHQRRLGIAGMNAVRHLSGGKDSVRIAEA